MAAQAGTQLSAFPDDCLDVRSVKYDVDAAGHIRHVVTTEIYLHAPSVRRHDMVNAAALKTEGVLDFLLSYIYTCHESDNGAVSGSALGPGKWQRFLDRARFAQLFVGKQATTGAAKRIFPLTYMRQLMDPNVVSLFIGLPAPDAAVAKAAAIDAGHPLDQEAPRLGHSLPAFTVDLKVFLQELDSFAHPVAYKSSEALPTVPHVARTKLVPSSVPADDSQAALDTVKNAVLAHYKAQHTDALSFFTQQQLDAITLGVHVGSEVPALAAASSGSVFHHKTMHGGNIPLTSVKQLMDPAVSTVVVIVPADESEVQLPSAAATGTSAAADAPAGASASASDASAASPAAPSAEPPAPSAPAVDDAAALNVSLDELDGGSGSGAVAEPTPEAATAPDAASADGGSGSGAAAAEPAKPLKVCVNDLVQAVSMDGAYTGPAKVTAVRAFGVMGDRVVDVQWSLDSKRTYGLPYSHVLELLED